MALRGGCVISAVGVELGNYGQGGLGLQWGCAGGGFAAGSNAEDNAVE